MRGMHSVHFKLAIISDIMLVLMIEKTPQQSSDALKTVGAKFKRVASIFSSLWLGPGKDHS